MSRPGVTGVAVGMVVAVAVVVYAVTDSAALDNVCYLGVLVGAGVGAWIGAERAPRGGRLVPRLIAAGASLAALGDVLWALLDAVGADTDVSIADLPWFASYVFLCLALWVVVSRSRGPVGSRIDTDLLLDALTIAVASLLVFWSTSIGAIVADHTVPPLTRVVTSAYPVADAILLALVVRVLVTRGSRGAIDVSFAIGACLWLAADVAYLHTAGTGASQVVMDAAWMVAPVLLARAAWRVPDVRAESPDTAARSGWVVQMIVAVGPLLVPPALELVNDVRGEPDQPLQLFVGTAALMTLAFVRAARLIRSEERARRELEVTRDAALEASEAKSLFLANISHELRTPLTTVLATAEMLEDTALDGLQLDLLAKMGRSGELLKRLVEEVLDFSRIEAGELVLSTSEFDLHAMVGDVADAYAPRAAAVDIGFRCQLDPCTPRTVTGDAGRLFQILSNLLDNALKFTHDGDVTLTVRPASDAGEAAQSEYVEFHVADTGIGIRHEDLESVFESFKQVDGSMTRSYGGSGLGLAICEKLAQLMSGCITVQSTYGSGTTFTVRVALPDADRDAGQREDGLAPSRVERLT